MSEKEKPVPKKGIKINIDRSDVLSILAVVISLATLFVSLKETTIMKEQQKIMQSGAKATVWPYLYIGPGSQSFNGETEVSISVINKGVGPAVINKVNFRIGEQSVKSIGELKNAAKKHFGSYAEMIHGTNFSTYEGAVISPGEALTLIKLKITSFEGIEDLLSSLGMEATLCYCSIYEDCWTINSVDLMSRKEGCVFD